MVCCVCAVGVLVLITSDNFQLHLSRYVGTSISWCLGHIITYGPMPHNWRIVYLEETVHLLLPQTYETFIDL